jgi:DNA processing protein
LYKLSTLFNDMNTITTITPADPYYPSGLNRLVDPPNRLFMMGHHQATKSQLAVVGSRKPTNYGRSVVESLIRALTGYEINIVSGLALGIDALAHKNALEHGLSTSAVLPSSLDMIYPASHRNLAKQILASAGALISEYPSGTRAAKYHFPARNRIIAALTEAVLVIEAAQKSGTMITVEHALDCGITVLAVPGSIYSTNSIGTNRLIKLGAVPVTSHLDILEVLGINAQENTPKLLSNPIDQAIVDALNQEASELGRLMQTTGIEMRLLQQRLTSMEITGHIKNIGNNTWSIS